MREKNRNHRPQGAGLPPLRIDDDIYMVDTPKETNGDKATGDNPSGKKAKHGRHRRRSKPRHNNTGTGEENLDGAEEEYDPDQPTFEQAE